MFPIKTDTNIIIFGAYIVYIVEPIDKQILFNTPSIVYTTSIALLSISNGNGCKQHADERDNSFGFHINKTFNLHQCSQERPEIWIRLCWQAKFSVLPYQTVPDQQGMCMP